MWGEGAEPGPAKPRLSIYPIGTHNISSFNGENGDRLEGRRVPGCGPAKSPDSVQAGRAALGVLTIRQSPVSEVKIFSH